MIGLNCIDFAYDSKGFKNAAGLQPLIGHGCGDRLDASYLNILLLKINFEN